jgi:hypothetical protein
MHKLARVNKKCGPHDVNSKKEMECFTYARSFQKMILSRFDGTLLLGMSFGSKN